MPQKDTYHEAVKNALIKDGWTITHDPYPLRYGEHRLYVDIGAEGPLAAEKAGRKIAVEINSLLGVSGMTDLERTRGQTAFSFSPSPAMPTPHSLTSLKAAT